MTPGPAARTRRTNSRVRRPLAASIRREFDFNAHKYVYPEFILHVPGPRPGTSTKRSWGWWEEVPGSVTPNEKSGRATPRPGRSAERSRGRRTDRVLSVPLIRLFYPHPDPSEEYPHEIVDIDGYAVAPDHSVTVAATVKSPGGLDMLDSVWVVLRKNGAARRRMLFLDDRGRTVSVMTIRPETSDTLLRLLRGLLVVPIRAHGGFLEVHFFATPDEVQALEHTIETGQQPKIVPPPVALPAAKETGALRPEDWAFLGLLSTVGAFDGPDGPTPELVADLLGLDPEAFAEQARAIERGLGTLVSDLFAPESSGSEPGRAAA